MCDRIDLSDLQPGTVITGVACVRQRDDKTTRSGKPYLDVTLGNRTGEARAKVWSENVSGWEDIQAGDGVVTKATVKSGWKGGPPELHIDDQGRLPDEHPIRLELNPICPTPVEHLVQRLDRLVDRFTRASSRMIWEAVIAYVGWETYAEAPAAMHHHHSYLHGLLEHSVEVGEIAVAMGARHAYRTHVDLDSVILGALVHDVGKVHEYEWRGTPITVSRLGLIRSHVSRGPQLIREALRRANVKADGNPIHRVELDHLYHVCESHHGKPEWGASSTPKSLEATIIHLADMVSARLRAFADDLEGAEPDADGWVEGQGWRSEPRWALRDYLDACWSQDRDSGTEDVA